MISFIGDLFVLFIIGMTSLLFHEIGHVTAARWYHASHIDLIVGAGKKVFAYSVGRLTVHVHQLFFMHFVTSSNRSSLYTSKEITMISMMGPVFSILLATVFYMLFHAFFSVYFLYVGFLFNLWLGIFNLIPFKIGHKTTDG